MSSGVGKALGEVPLYEPVQREVKLSLSILRVGTFRLPDSYIKHVYLMERYTLSVDFRCNSFSPYLESPVLPNQRTSPQQSIRTYEQNQPHHRI